MDVGILKKISLVLCLLFGCSGVKENKEPFEIQIFYSETCPKCKLLRENLMPRIEEEFGDQVSFVLHDIDLKESVDLFYEYTGLYDWQLQEWTIEGKLRGVAIDELCNEDKTECGITWIPFVVIGESYAFFGYDDNYIENYIRDIHLILQGKASTLNYGYEFKN